MRITALAGGVGGARFLRGLAHHLNLESPDRPDPDTSLTIIGNTGDDITLFGLRVCPDVDTIMYTLGGGINENQGWGRCDESMRVQGELAHLGVSPQWFSLGDLDMATHIARSLWLGQGQTLSQATAAIAQRWGLPERGITVLPMSDDPVETHVVIDDEDGRRAIHFQEWWVRLHASVPAESFVAVGMDRARPAPGVLEAIRTADVVVLPPSNPVVSIGIILGVPGVRDALRGTRAPVVGVSPLIAGRPVRGYADACLAALNVPQTAAGVASLYADFLDGWLVDPADFTATEAESADVVVKAHDGPLLMGDTAEAAHLAASTLDLANQCRTQSDSRP